MKKTKFTEAQIVKVLKQHEASHIINIRELKSYHKGNGGYLVLSDDTKIDISKSRREDFLLRVKL